MTTYITHQVSLGHLAVTSSELFSPAGKTTKTKNVQACTSRFGDAVIYYDDTPPQARFISYTILMRILFFKTFPLALRF